MSTTISDLPSISGPIQTTDLFIVRRATTDYQAAANLIQTLNVPALGAAVNYSPNDLMVIWNLGTSQLRNIQYGQVGFPIGTMTWFYQNTVPVNWITVKGTGDRILACAEPGLNYQSVPSVAGGLQGGTWQQYPVNPLPVSATQTGFNTASPGGNAFGGLQTSQIPTLTGVIGATNPVLDVFSQQLVARGKGTIPDYNIPSSVNTGVAGVEVGLPHDHGALWRPAANVGKIGIKVT